MSTKSQWAYVNYRNQYTRIHNGTCPFCKHGEGTHGGGSTPNGSWIHTDGWIQPGREVTLSTPGGDFTYVALKCSRCDGGSL